MPVTSDQKTLNELRERRVSLIVGQAVIMPTMILTSIVLLAIFEEWILMGCLSFIGIVPSLLLLFHTSQHLNTDKEDNVNWFELSSFVNAACFSAGVGFVSLRSIAPGQALN